MAKNSKAAEIREYLARHPEAKALMWWLPSRPSVSDSARPTSTSSGPAASQSAGPKGPQGDTITALIEAKKLADKLGGVDRAREALNALAMLLYCGRISLRFLRSLLD